MPGRPGGELTSIRPAMNSLFSGGRRQGLLSPSDRTVLRDPALSMWAIKATISRSQESTTSHHLGPVGSRFHHQYCHRSCRISSMHADYRPPPA